MASPDERRRLLRGAGSFSLPVLVSQALGVGREMAFAAVFGAGHAADAFVTAYRLPNLLRDLFAENATSAAVVPVYADARARRGPAEARRFAGRALGTLGAAAATLALVGIVLADPLARWIAPGFADVPGKIDLTARLARIMFPYLVLVSAAAVLQGVLQGERVFWTVGAASSLSNVAWIAVALAVAVLDSPPIEAMAVAVLAGGALQVAVQVPPLRRAGVRIRPEVAPRDADVRRAAGLMGPAVLGSVAWILMVYANTVFASFYAEGAMAHLNYAFRVMHVPLGLIGVAAGTVLLPSVTEALVRGRADEARATVRWALLVAGGAAAAAAAALALLAEPVVRLLFERGAFGAADTGATVAALRAYLPTVVFASMTRVVSASFYARHETRTPAAVGGVAIALAIASNAAAVFALRAPFWAIAAGTSVASAANFAILFALDRRRG